MLKRRKTLGRKSWSNFDAGYTTNSNRKHTEKFYNQNRRLGKK